MKVVHPNLDVVSREKLAKNESFFAVLQTGEKSQTALMNLKPGQTSGEYGTEHPESDQVMIVLEGHGRVMVEDETREIEPGDVVFIPAGAKHKVYGPNKSLNVYSPKAYPDNYREEEGTG